MGYFDCRLLDLKKVACVLRLASHYAFTELTHALALQNTKKNNSSFRYVQIQFLCSFLVSYSVFVK